MKPTDAIASALTVVSVTAVSFFGDAPTTTNIDTARIERGNRFGDYIVSDPYLPCVKSDKSDCRTWDAPNGRPHYGADLAGGAIDTSSKRLTVPGRKGQKYRVECSGDKHATSGYGLLATIAIDGVELRYGHLSACHSDNLKAGSTFGVSSNSGHSTAPHIHYETRVDGEPVPPIAQYLKQSLTGSVAEDVTLFADGDIDALYTAIVEQESGGQAAIVNTHSGAIGLGQIMPSNVAPWSRQCLGRELTPDALRRDATAQETIVKCKLREYWSQVEGDERTKVRKVAAIWYSGRADLVDSDRPQPYGANVYPSIKDYSNSIADKYFATRSTNSEVATAGDLIRKTFRVWDALKN